MTSSSRSTSIEDDYYEPEPLSPGIDHCRDPLRSRLSENRRQAESDLNFAQRMQRISLEYGTQKSRSGETAKENEIREIDIGQACLHCKDICKGYEMHPWRNNCVSCRCKREQHDIGHASKGALDLRSRLGWVEDTARAQLGVEGMALQSAKRLGYDWVPDNIPDDMVEEYMDQLDNNKIPKVASAGQRYRRQQLIVQFPRQDISLKYCKTIQTEAEAKSFKAFCDMRDSTVLDFGVVKQAKYNMSCHACDGELESGDLAVFVAPDFQTEINSENVCWHPACFACARCDELLVDLAYCHNQGRLYCQRHFAEIIKQRCKACDELIFSSEYTRAMDDDWHSGHFSCWQCEISLTGHRYILRDEHPFCIGCYEKQFANTCEECKKVIGSDYKDLSYKDRHWHEKCFHCYDCKGSLVEQPFASRDDNLYCADCYDNNFAARCDGCTEMFRAGMKKYEYKGKQWHEDCFCCQVCEKPIGNQSFIPRDMDVVCVPCYEDKYAQKCAKCNGVIDKGGVTYKNQPWHRECFTCVHCSKILSGEKFTSRDEQPYCSDCFGELFAKKCTKCTKPITGLGGTKFISFEERHWHSGCFGCYKCQVSLVGRGFLTIGEDVLCPDCARA